VNCYRCGAACLACICAPCPACEPQICATCPLNLEDVKTEHGHAVLVMRGHLENGEPVRELEKVFRTRAAPTCPVEPPRRCSLDNGPVPIYTQHEKFVRTQSSQLATEEELTARAFGRAIANVFGFVAAGVVAGVCVLAIAAAAVFSVERPHA